MTDATATLPPPPSALAAPGHPVVSEELGRWLDTCEARLLHPGSVVEELRRRGWPLWAATEVGERYRSRFDEHPLGYSALLVSVGVAALAAGTSAHIALDVAELGDPVPAALAGWLTVLVVAVPFALLAARWALQVDRNDPVAVWSRPRRTLAQVLVWACGVVGGVRLVGYAHRVIVEVTGAETVGDGRSLGYGLANVLVTLALAAPLGVWAFRFQHRFDAEDPTAPRRRTRTERPAPPVGAG